MSRKRLSFNPYTVSDERLMTIVENAGWGDEYDITQIVKLHFTRLREVCDIRRFDGIFIKIGVSDDEVFIPSGSLKYRVTAFDTLQGERTMYGTKPIRRDEDIQHLVGKSAFVSHTIRGHNISGQHKIAYIMHPLSGNIHKDAAMIREKMCKAKIKMLQRILDHPECEYFLNCRPGLFDYTSRINLAIELIRHFNEVIPPKSQSI